MSNVLNKSELLQVLEVLSNRMQAKGMLPAHVPNKDQVLEKLAQSIDEHVEIEKNALNNPAVQKTLALSIMSVLLSEKDPYFKFDFIALFREKANPDELKNELSSQLLFVLTYVNRLNPKKQFSPQALHGLVDNVAETLTNHFMREQQDNPAENEMVSDIFAESLSLALRNLYGGIDPRIAGGEVMPVYEIVGNLTGIVNFAGANPTSHAFMDEVNRFDARPDPLGIENAVRIRLDSISDEIESDLNQLGIITDNHWPPRLENY